MNEPTGMTAIEALVKDYADKRVELNIAVQTLQTAIAEAYERHMPEVRAAIEEVKETHQVINQVIAGNPQLFEKPRTVVFHGIRIGLAKGQGGMHWACEDDVLVARIRKMFKDDGALLEQLIITKEKPSKEGLEDLDVDQLKKLGVEVHGTGDRVVIKPADTVVDKTVRALLKAAPSGEE